MRYQKNPAFERQLERDPRSQKAIKHYADETADEANDNIRAMFRPEVMTPFMPKGGYRSRGGKSPVRSMRDPDGIYVTNLDHGGHLYEYGSEKTPMLAPLRRAARKVVGRFVPN